MGSIYMQVLYMGLDTRTLLVKMMELGAKRRENMPSELEIEI